ncbi:MAG: site-specific DNA-methyltransferase [Firmicutes bacterium]|nr:site-specific DNA-methyltransferase [Bacillota bacterium]
MEKSLQTTKLDLITEIDRRVEDKILEQSNADLLKKLINNAETSTEAISIAELGTTYRMTGFHFDKRFEKLENTIKYFKKNTSLSFSDGKNETPNKLIIGDNYDALLNLLIEYKGKIDVIYIDPPYGKDKMGEFAKTSYDNALTRDNLLSMLYPRLVIAKQLLSSRGIIFCSIDDKNQAYVKCLFDEIFREARSLSTIAWERRTKCQNTDTAKRMLQSKVEYIFVYKNYDERAEFNCHVLSEKSYTKSDDKGSYREEEIGQMSSNGMRGRTSMIFPILGILPRQGNQWKLGKDTIDELLKRNDVFVRNEKVYRKVRPYDESQDNIKPFWGYMPAEQFGTAETAKKELDDILGRKDHGFETVKPVGLMEELIYQTTKSDSIILDFFAGSGTTGQAVIETNIDYGGNRKFILCTNNEITAGTPNGIAYDVTTKRLKRTMTGSCYDGSTNFKWLESHKALGGSLDVYEIASVANFEKTIGKTPFDVIDETLYGKQRFTSVREKIEWVCGNFEGTQKIIENDEEWLKRMGENN